VCCWKNFRRFLFWAACFVTLLVLGLLEENVRGKRAWQRHRRQLEAAGEKLDLAELIPPPVNDESNLALMPLFKPLFEFTQSKQGTVWGNTNGIARLNQISATLPAHGEARTFMGSLDKGTFADMDRARDFYMGNTNYPQAEASAMPAQTILTALGKFDADVKVLRDAAASRPYSRFPIQYGHQPSWEILLPHLSHLKALTVLLNVRAVAELEASNAPAAFEDLKLGMRLSDSVKAEPLLIDHLVRMALVAINLQTVREGLARHAWSEAQLREIDGALGDIDLLAEYKLAMRGERALCVGGLEYLSRNGPRANPMYYLENDAGSAGIAGNFGLMPSGFFYQNMLTISRMHGEYTLKAVKEKEHRVYPELADGYIRSVEKLGRGPYTIFARMLLPAVEKAVSKSARHQFYTDAGRLSCAIERYRMANGALPGNLNELAPKYINAIPTDVIDGEPLRHKLDSAGSYRLYSVGWNGTDEGGELAWKEGKKNVDIDAAKGDWVWSMTQTVKHD
jgi:hypothetical protein